MKKFLLKLDPVATDFQYQMLTKTLNETFNCSTFLEKVQNSKRTGGYENLLPVFVLALILPLENATSEGGFFVMNNIKNKKKRARLGEQILFDLLLLAI